MSTDKGSGKNYNVVVSPDSEAHESLVANPGVVSGETNPDAVSAARLEGLASLEKAFRSDAMLRAAWEATAAEPPLARIEAFLDRINAERHELDASDADAEYKAGRQRMLSDVSDKLRELL